MGKTKQKIDLTMYPVKSQIQVLNNSSSFTKKMMSAKKWEQVVIFIDDNFIVSDDTLAHFSKKF